MKSKLFTLGVVTNYGSADEAVIIKMSAVANSNQRFESSTFLFEFGYFPSDIKEQPSVTAKWGLSEPLSADDCVKFGLDKGIKFCS